MAVTELNHYFVRANDLERTRRFYCDVLGFQVMPRPDFPFPGHWLGVNGKVQVHLGTHGVPNSQLYCVGSTEGSATDNTGVVDHIAFLADAPETFVKRFDALGLAVRKRYFPQFQLYQMFVQGPRRPDDRTQLQWNRRGLAVEPGQRRTTPRCRVWRSGDAGSGTNGSR